MRNGLVGVVCFAIVVVGCSSSGSDDGAATGSMVSSSVGSPISGRVSGVSATTVGSLSASATTVSSDVASMTFSERVELIAACMQDRGLSVTFSDVGGAGISYDNRVVSEEMFDSVSVSCEEDLMAEGRIGPAPGSDPAYLSKVFQSLLDSAECLRDNGYVIEDAPSEQVWIESKGAVWNPYNTLEQSGGVEAWEEAQKLCPQDVG